MFNFTRIQGFVEKLSTYAGTAWAAFHIVQAVRGNEPPEDAKVAKAVYGGLFSSEDENEMLKVEKLLDPEELKTLKANRAWIRNNFGSGVVGWTANWAYQNRFRVFVVKKSVPKKEIKEEVMKPDKKNPGKFVLDFIRPVVIPADYTEAVNWLKEYVAEINRVSAATNGSAEQKKEAGFQAGVEWLRDQGAPAPFFSKGITKLDEFVTHLPTKAGAAGNSIINNLEQRGANRSKKSWWRKWL
jgi:hypothetical protein